MYVSPEKVTFDEYDEPRLHTERLLKTRLIDFDLSMRILCPLEDRGIKTLGDLTQISKRQLRRMPRMGRLSAQILEDLMASFHLSFKD